MQERLFQQPDLPCSEDRCNIFDTLGVSRFTKLFASPVFSWGAYAFPASEGFSRHNARVGNFPGSNRCRTMYRSTSGQLYSYWSGNPWRADELRGGDQWERGRRGFFVHSPGLEHAFLWTVANGMQDVGILPAARLLAALLEASASSLPQAGFGPADNRARIGPYPCRAMAVGRSYEAVI